MTLYFLTTGRSVNTLERISLLRDACERRGMVSVFLETETADRLSLPTLQRGDALYNATREGVVLEERLWRPGVATFYSGDGSPRGLQDTTRWIADHERAGLAQPRTVVHATADRSLLGRYVEFLGGFPLVVKVAGGSMGTGVMRVDSWAALQSLADYLVSTGVPFILREMLGGGGSLRLMVIGEQVVGTLAYEASETDFRTNADSGVAPHLIQADAEVEALAVAAVRAMGAELGGVDVMFDTEGKAYVLETNLPCGFATFHTHGVDVAGAMVDFLCAKAERLSRA